MSPSIAEKQEAKAQTPSSSISTAISPIPWQSHAGCRNADTEIFFSDHTGPAVALCDQCPVVSNCLLQACLDEELVQHRFGVFGGLTPRERRRLVRAEPRWRELLRLLCDEELERYRDG